jgi:uncharacterized SAM-binding protein YcdF (DUF218 family)
MPYFLFSPIAWAVPLLLVMLVAWRRLARGWRIAGIATGALLLLACMPIGANALERLLEALAPRGAMCAVADEGPIVVLAGGFEHAPRREDDYAAFTLESWDRLRAATELWHHRGDGVLWITGGGPLRIKEATMLARLAADWQVPPAAIRTEARSTSTWESAFALAPALRGQRARLVTSPWHRARALYAFRKAGVEACLHDTGSDVVPFDGVGHLVPQASAIAKSETVLYELVGLVWYRMRALPPRAEVGRPAASE